MWFSIAKHLIVRQIILFPLDISRKTTREIIAMNIIWPTSEKLTKQCLDPVYTTKEDKQRQFYNNDLITQAGMDFVGGGGGVN